jgi:hypothetical protein
MMWLKSSFDPCQGIYYPRICFEGLRKNIEKKSTFKIISGLRFESETSKICRKCAVFSNILLLNAKGDDSV